MIDDLLTPRIMRLPAAIAAKHARSESEREELESIGNLALVKAARMYDPRHESRASFVTLAHRYIRNAVLTAIGVHSSPSPTALHSRRWKALRSLDVAIGDDLTLAQVVPDKSVCPSDLAEIGEEYAMADAILRRLAPIDQLIYRWCDVDGVSLREVAERLGNSLGTSAIHGRLLKARRSIKRRVWALHSGQCSKPPETPLPVLTPTQERKREKNAAASTRQRFLAKKMAGDIPGSSRKWYLVNDQSRTLMYSSHGINALLGKLNITPTVNLCGRGTAGRYIASLAGTDALSGGRIVRGPEARRLVRDSGYRYVADQSAISTITRKLSSQGKEASNVKGDQQGKPHAAAEARNASTS